MKHWDSVARAYVEYDTSAMETFGPLDYDGGGTVEYDGGVVRWGDAVIPPDSLWQPANDNAPVSTTPRADRKAAYVLAYSGRFYPFDPKPEDVRIADIAHGLAASARYNGAGRRFYSTAEHSIHIARWLLSRYGVEVALAGLLHDAPEPLSGFGDVLRPVKDSAPIIKETETNIWRNAIALAFDLPLDIPPAVHEADSRIIVDEMSQNMREVDPAYTVPLGVMLQFWGPERAEVEFLCCFKDLMLKRQEARRVAA